MATKTGRPRKPYVTSWGDHVNGLRRRPRDGRWVIVETGQIFTESSETRAVQRFRDWQSRNSGERLNLAGVGQGLVGDSDASDAMSVAKFARFGNKSGRLRIKARDASPETLEQVAAGDYSNCDITLEQKVHESAIWPWMRELLIERPEYVAEKLGIPELARLADLPKRKPSPTLDELIDLYVEHGRCSDHEKKKSRTGWADFSDAMKAKGITTANKITTEAVAEWQSDVVGRGKSAAYVAYRITKVKAVLNLARKHGRDVASAIEACAILTKPKQAEFNPQPISRQDFGKLFDAADDVFRAFLLLGLNCAMYPSELFAVEWKSVDLTKGTLSTSRGKTGVSRVAVLWPRTVEALEKLERRNEYVFGPVARYPGDAPSVKTATTRWGLLRKAAGVSTDVKMADLRDGAQTAAAEAGVPLDQIRVLAGHRTGISDHYVRRRPTLVADACRAIEEAYFGSN